MTELDHDKEIARELIIECLMYAKDYTMMRADIKNYVMGRWGSKANDKLGTAINVLDGMIISRELERLAGDAANYPIRIKPKLYMYPFTQAMIEFDTNQHYRYLPEDYRKMIDMLKPLFKEYEQFQNNKVVDFRRQELYEALGNMFSGLKSNITAQQMPEVKMNDVVKSIGQIRQKFLAVIARDNNYRHDHKQYEDAFMEWKYS